jgi:hypothetical protein
MARSTATFANKSAAGGSTRSVGLKKPKSDVGEGEEFIAFNAVSYFQMWRLDWTPWFCRTKYQKSFARIMKKAEYRLHRELNFTQILSTLRETSNLTKSFFLGPTFE